MGLAPGAWAAGPPRPRASTVVALETPATVVFSSDGTVRISDAGGEILKAVRLADRWAFDLGDHPLELRPGGRPPLVLELQAP